MKNSSNSADFKKELTALLPRLARYARVLTPSQHDADDLLQKSCERALSRWQQLDSTKNMDRWVFTIMNSVWKNEIRSIAIRQGQGFVSTDELDSPKTSPDGHIYLRQVLERVMALPENQREIVLLVYVEGFSYAKAAEIANIPIGTVMSRLSRAREALCQWAGESAKPSSSKGGLS